MAHCAASRITASGSASAPLQRRQGSRVAAVAEDQGGIPDKTAPLRPP